MNVELIEAREHVLGRLLWILELPELSAEDSLRDRAEVGVAAGGGEGEAVAQSAREPRLQ
jgi:hypothetical protein